MHLKQNLATPRFEQKENLETNAAEYVHVATPERRMALAFLHARSRTRQKLAATPKR
jgi:hypothetical protein